MNTSIERSNSQSSNLLDPNPTLEQQAREVVRDQSVLYCLPKLREIIGGLLKELDMERVYAKAAMDQTDDYLRGLVHNLGAIIGEAAYTCDDGTVSEYPLSAKMPELLVQLVDERWRFKSALEFYSKQEHLVGFSAGSLAFNDAYGGQPNWLIPHLDEKMDMGQVEQLVADVTALMVEDGGIARGVLAGGLIINNGDDVHLVPANPTEVYHATLG